MGDSKHSSSLEQCDAEEKIIGILNKQFSVSFERNKIFYFGKAKPQVDFFSESKCIIGEIYAHDGRGKGAQPKKILADILKMLYIDAKTYTKHEKIIAIHSDKLEKQLKGGSWLSDAIATFGIKIVKIDLPETDKEMIRQAQERQRMTNAY